MTTRFDLLVTDGTVVGGARSVRADVAVTAGRIAALLPSGSCAPANRVVPAAGLLVLPGLIDSHVHFRTPGLTHKADWRCGSRAAVAGGVTTVIDMPNTRPPMRTSADAIAKHAMIEGSSLVDYRFHAGVDPLRVDRVRDLDPRHAQSVKVFLSGHHTAPDVVRDPADLERLFALGAELDRILVFHAEDDGIFALLDQWSGAPARYADYEPHRPRTAGIVAVAKLVELARRHGTQTHVLHVSSREEADLLTAAAASGIPVTFEVTAHHLTFTNADTCTLGSRIRLRPAIRDESDRDRLWQAVIAGHAATVGSDHAPHTITEKELPVPDAPPGLPGVQELLPALYSGLLRRLPRSSPVETMRIVVRLLAEGPAQLFGLDHRKGAVAAGLDADLVLFDPDRQWNLTPADVQAKCGWSAYEDQDFTGGVVATIRRGELVYEWSAQAPAFGAPTGVWL